MEEHNGTSSFDSLSQAEQDRYWKVMHEFLAFAQERTIPLYFGPPLVTGGVPVGGGRVAPVTLPQSLGKIDGASGSILQLYSGCYFVTAEHVLRGYEERIEGGEQLKWKIGTLAPFDPVPRIAWRDKTDAYERSLIPYRPTDIIMLQLATAEAGVACGAGSIISTPEKWPPLAPETGDALLMAGYPNQLGSTDLTGTMKREACGLVFRVTHVGEGYCKCQFAYRELIDIKGGSAQPDLASINLGGMSGAPVFCIARTESGLVQFPRFCGVFTDRWGGDPDSDILEIATFDQVRSEDFAGASG